MSYAVVFLFKVLLVRSSTFYRCNQIFLSNGGFLSRSGTLDYKSYYINYPYYRGWIASYYNLIATNGLEFETQETYL